MIWRVGNEKCQNEELYREGKANFILAFCIYISNELKFMLA